MTNEERARKTVCGWIDSKPYALNPFHENELIALVGKAINDAVAEALERERKEVREKRLRRLRANLDSECKGVHYTDAYARDHGDADERVEREFFGGKERT